MPGLSVTLVSSSRHFPEKCNQGKLTQNVSFSCHVFLSHEDCRVTLITPTVWSHFYHLLPGFIWLFNLKSLFLKSLPFGASYVCFLHLLSQKRGICSPWTKWNKKLGGIYLVITIVVLRDTIMAWMSRITLWQLNRKQQAYWVLVKIWKYF